MQNRVNKSFFIRDVLDVAPGLLGKILVRNFGNGETGRFRITEVEAYRGTNDLACHASKGRTARTEVMFLEGGIVYVYLIYGMYWMLNIVTGEKEDASAVLIRGMDRLTGPGRVGKMLRLDKSFYGEDLSVSDRIWFEEGEPVTGYCQTARIGIQYSGEPWISKPWRYLLV